MNLLRKRTCNRVADNLVWTLISFLPILFLLALCISNGKNLVNYDYYNFIANNLALQPFSIFYDLFYSIFGSEIFIGRILCFYCDWLICVNLCHLVVDFLMFIFRFVSTKLHKVFNVKEDKELNIFNNVLYLILYTLPIIIGIITVLSLGENVLTFNFSDIFIYNGFNGIPFFLNIFNSLFGFDGILPFYYINIFYIFAWFCTVELFKFLSDMLTLVFKWMHNKIEEF